MAFLLALALLPCVTFTADTLREVNWTLPSLERLVREGKTEPNGKGYRLTDAGGNDARNLVRAHRLWESYLSKNLEAPDAHFHDSAERLKHVIGAGLQRRLHEEVGRPLRDPQGKRIPPRFESLSEG